MSGWRVCFMIMIVVVLMQISVWCFLFFVFFVFCFFLFGFSCTADRLALSHGPYVEKSLGVLSNLTDQFIAEQNKLLYYHRQVARQKAQQEAFLTQIVMFF